MNLGVTFAAAIYNYCLEKISIILPGTSKERAELFASFYSNAFIGVVTHYVTSPDDYPLEEIYSFLENRVDELCSSYVKQYLNK